MIFAGLSQDELLLGRYCLYLTTHVAGEVVGNITLTQERGGTCSMQDSCFEVCLCARFEERREFEKKEL